MLILRQVIKYQNMLGVVYISIISIIILVENSNLNFINLSELVSISYGILRLVQPAHSFFNFLSNLVAVSGQLERINSKLFSKSNLKNSFKKIESNSTEIKLDSKFINYSLKNISHKFENSIDFVLS